uniref:Uncharacterized protein n=1 Tax=Ananas comosus var. bracteatus TaxID=296719 RepID=A0A6V7Q9S6_ANACO|nr:unnamed protein product [Ananas comosus var. bracteatus]
MPHVLEAVPVELREDLSFEEQPVKILAREVKKLRNRDIPYVKFKPSFLLLLLVGSFSHHWSLTLELGEREISTLGGFWTLLEASQRHEDLVLAIDRLTTCHCAHSHMLVRVAPYKPALRRWPSRFIFAVRDWAPKWIAVGQAHSYGGDDDYHGAIRLGTGQTACGWVSGP